MLLLCNDNTKIKPKLSHWYHDDDNYADIIKGLIMTLQCDVYGTMKPLTYLEIDYDDDNDDDNRDYSNDESDDDNGDSIL